MSCSTKYVFLGFGPIPWTLNAEIHPPESTRLCASISFAFNWLCAFIIVQINSPLIESINNSGAYFLFGSICFIGNIEFKKVFRYILIRNEMLYSGIFIIYFSIPETRGKSSEEMKAYFLQKYGSKWITLEAYRLIILLFIISLRINNNYKIEKFENEIGRYLFRYYLILHTK